MCFSLKFLLNIDIACRSIFWRLALVFWLRIQNHDLWLDNYDNCMIAVMAKFKYPNYV